MKLKSNLLTLALLAALGLTACDKQAMEAPVADAAPMAADTAMSAETSMPVTAKYSVVFTPTWTKANFPTEYPDTSLFHKPHFSGWIGTAHNDGYRIFAEGATPSAGLERLSEMGEHSPLDAEINAAVAAGNALALSESDPLKDFSQTASFEIVVDEAHPMASAVAMIAPSPDWFAGAEVNLLENGEWIASKTVDVMAWDSGGDNGATYLADDADANPKQPSMISTGKHFMKGGKTMPVGTLTFTKL